MDEMRSVSNSATKLQNDLDHKKMSRRDLDDAAKAAAALAERLKQLETEAAMNQRKLDERLDAVAAASRGDSGDQSSESGSWAVSGSEEGQVTLEGAEEVIVASLESAVQSVALHRDPETSPTRTEGEGRTVMVESHVFKSIQSPTEGEDFVLMEEDEYCAIQRAKAVVPAEEKTTETAQGVTCTSSVGTTVILSSDEAVWTWTSHIRWCFVLCIAIGLDMVAQAEGVDTFCLTSDANYCVEWDALSLPWSPEAWVGINLCFILATFLHAVVLDKGEAEALVQSPLKL